MMRRILLIVFLVLLYPLASMAYNHSYDRYESQEPQLQYNPHQNEWSWQRPDSRLDYNPYENRWRWRQPGERLRYNPYQQRWEYK